MAGIDKFFEKQTERSRIKTEIAVKYFVMWSKIIGRSGKKLNYYDLFSGCGKFKEGKRSTPLQIFDKIEELNLENQVSTFFYEGNKSYYNSLKEEISNHTIYTKLVFEPSIFNKTITSEFTKEIKFPKRSFTFIDPYGYKGLSEELINSVVKNWGCDCLFYISTHGIKRNIRIDNNKDDLIVLFGREGYQTVREELKKKKSFIFQDQLILKTIRNNLTEKEIYFQEFGVEFEKSKLTSHYLVFLSKHHRGFELIKEIMAKVSKVDSKGIPFFLHSSIENSRELPQLDGLSEGMEKLKQKIKRDFSSKKIMVEKIIELCNINHYKYTRTNIKEALIELENSNALMVDKPQNERIRKGKITLGDKRIITFK